MRLQNPFFVASVAETHAGRLAVVPALPVPPHPTPPSAPMPAPPRSAPASDNLPAIDNAAALLADTAVTLPPEIIEGMLHQGLKGVLGSSSKARKTWILLDLALSVATGTQWWGCNTTKGKVLYVNFEIPKAFLRQRIQKLCETKNITDLQNLEIWTLRGHSTSFNVLVPRMLKTISSAGHVLIIIDPIYKGLAGKDENSAGDVSELCNQLEKLAVQTGAAVLYAHHFSKGNQSKKQPMDRIGGSGAFARDADTIITLTKHDKDDCYTVEMSLRNLPEKPPFVVEWQYPLMIARPGMDPAKLMGIGGRPKQDHSDKLLDLLREKPMTTTEWKNAAEAEAGIKKGKFYDDFEVLKLGNYIEKVPTSKKKWRVAAVQLAKA